MIEILTHKNKQSYRVKTALKISYKYTMKMKYKYYNSWKRYASKWDLKIFKFSAETTCSGRLFHVDTFLVANECFLRLFRVRSTINFLLCPHVRVSVEGLKIPLSYILNMKMRSPRSLRASWLVKLRLRLRSNLLSFDSDSWVRDYLKRGSDPKP